MGCCTCGEADLAVVTGRGHCPQAGRLGDGLREGKLVVF